MARPCLKPPGASGDEYEIQAQTFGKPLRNRMESVPDEGLVAVTQL